MEVLNSKLAIDLLKSTSAYRVKSIDYHLEVREGGDRLTIWNVSAVRTDDTFLSLELIPLFATFSKLLSYNKDEKRIELVLF